MKKVLAVIGLLILIGYLGFSAFYFKDMPKEHVCQKLEIEIVNKTDDASFVNEEEIKTIIAPKKINPVGKQLKDINTSAIEEAIMANQMVKKASVYITDNGSVKVSLVERKPVLRIIASSGENYYIDSEGEKMGLSRTTTAYVPLATGAVKESFAKDDLYNFALFLLDNEFWNAQIEQIVVYANNDVRLIPRVGDQQILMGKLDNYEAKLDKLMLFYEKGQNEIGWNKYSTINLKYDKQIVCTKR